MEKIITVYGFNELAPLVQKKVINDFESINVNGIWWRDICIKFKDMLEKNGFENIEMYCNSYLFINLKSYFKGRFIGIILNFPAPDKDILKTLSEQSDFMDIIKRIEEIKDGFEKCCCGCTVTSCNFNSCYTIQYARLKKLLHKILENEYKFQTSTVEIQKTLSQSDYLFASNGLYLPDKLLI